jgi:hypothetical protein
MKKISGLFCSSLMSFFFVFSGTLYANDSLLQQELVLEEQLANATSSEHIAKITFALSNIKKQQSLMEFKKLPEMVGRDRSFLTASVRDSMNFRQMASTFKREPAGSSIAYSYKIGNFLATFCMVFAFVILFVRSQSRYRY